MTTSVRRRFAFTVVANLLRALLSFATGMLTARWLGPDAYGRMAFLLGTFLALRQFLDMGSSAAFFTFMSQKMRSRRFVNGFAMWLGLQFLVPLCVIGLLFPSNWIEMVWRGNERSLVVLAFVATFFQNSAWPIFQQAGESQRRTILVQGVSAAVVVIHLLAVLVFWRSDRMGLYAIFAAIACEYFVAVLLVRSSLTYAAANESESTDAKAVLASYVRYCLPLVPYAWIGFAYEFADRWLLQTFGGSIQQAYYAVGAQFAAIALLATSSILNIFWKEMAEANHRGDHARARALYHQVSRSLFFVGAAASGFLIPWAAQLLDLLVGAAYVGGAATLSVMFLYPIHQSMGQIGATTLYATERVSIQVTLGIASMIVSMVATYFVLAPTDAQVPGLGLASIGLALKMVLIQIIQVNIVAYVISRVAKWPYDWTYQPISLAACGIFGWLSYKGAMYFTSDEWPVLYAIGLSGVCYLVLLVAFVYTLPGIIGFTRTNLVSDVAALFRLGAARLRST